MGLDKEIETSVGMATIVDGAKLKKWERENKDMPDAFLQFEGESCASGERSSILSVGELLDQVEKNRSLKFNRESALNGEEVAPAPLNEGRRSSLPGALRCGGGGDDDSANNNDATHDEENSPGSNNNNDDPPILSAMLVVEHDEKTMDDSERRQIEIQVKQEMLKEVVEAEEYREPCCPRYCCTWKCRGFSLLLFLIVLLLLFIFREPIGKGLGLKKIQWPTGVNNMICEQARAINYSHPIVLGNMYGATEQYGIIPCTRHYSDSSGSDDDPSMCVAGSKGSSKSEDFREGVRSGGSQSSSSSSSDDGKHCDIIGLWYTVIGTGYPLKASTCNDNDGPAHRFAVQVSVYENSCSELQCVKGSNNPCSSGLQNSVSWPSVEGVKYSILVHSWNESAAFSNTEDSQFELKIESVVENDFCETAIGPLEETNDSNNTIMIQGDTTSASFSGLVEHCHDRGRSRSRSAGLWYTIVGTGVPLMAQANSLGLHTRISIYAGKSCDQLECWAAGDDPFSYDSSVTWEATEGQLYYILVDGAEGGEVGSFELSILEGIANNFCTAAMDISTQRTTTTASAVATSTVMGSTKAAVITDLPPSCGSYALSGPGVWYKVVGNGRVLRASTCNSSKNDNMNNTSWLDTSLSVYRGNNFDDCSHLTCVEESSEYHSCDSNGIGSLIQWVSKESELYLILVTGKYYGQVGSFVLELEEFSA